MPINASLAPKEEQEEITLNSVCEEKMHNNQTLATSNSSASIQSSPGKYFQIDCYNFDSIRLIDSLISILGFFYGRLDSIDQR